MKNFKYYMSFLAFLLILQSCDNRKAYIEKGLPSPGLVLNKFGVSIEADTFKYQSKSLPNLSYNLDINGDKEDKEVSLTLSGGTADISINGKTALESTKLKNGTYSLTIIPKTGSKLILTIESKDQYGKISKKELKLYCFDNMEPVASFEVKKLGVNSELEYVLDASSSYDADGAWGGAIVKYNFKINDYEFTYSKPNPKFVFNETGNYNITLTVTDNNNISTKINKIVTIN